MIKDSRSYPTLYLKILISDPLVTGTLEIYQLLPGARSPLQSDNMFNSTLLIYTLAG